MSTLTQMFKNLFNFSFTKKVWAKIGLSISSEKVSSIRIQAFILLFPVVSASFIFITIELINAIIAWKNNIPYIPSNESIIIFGMILSHHISVLFSRSKPQNYYSIDTDITKNENTDITVKKIQVKPVVDPNIEENIEETK
jgi:hypothetical protein